MYNDLTHTWRIHTGENTGVIATIIYSPWLYFAKDGSMVVPIILCGHVRPLVDMRDRLLWETACYERPLVDLAYQRLQGEVKHE